MTQPLSKLKQDLKRCEEHIAKHDPTALDTAMRDWLKEEISKHPDNLTKANV